MLVASRAVVTHPLLESPALDAMSAVSKTVPNLQRLPPATFM
jgi:hypothetical protein